MKTNTPNTPNTSIHPICPICPKCGYDQSGEIATWELQCPLEGRCPECGLDFVWADVLDPNRVELGWYVEHAKTKWDMVRRTIPTLWMLMIPNRYWKRVTMETGRSTKRFAIWVVMVMIVLHLIGTGMMVGARVGYVLYDNNEIEQIKIGQTESFVAMVDGMKTQMDSAFWAQVLSESTLYPLVKLHFFDTEVAEVLLSFAFISFGIACMWLILMSIFPTTRKRSQLRMIHVVRAVVVSGLTPMLVMELGRMLDVVAAFASWVPWLKGMTWQVWSRITLVTVLGTLAWLQWFWISAVWRGWKIKARWYEMILVMLASFGGLLIGGILAWAVLGAGEWLGDWLSFYGF